jgi:hypothetical protein
MSNKIIVVSGLIGSGKDTIADYLCTVHGFKRLSFASALKDAVSAVFGWDREMLEGSTKSSREWREQVDPWWSERLGMPQLTPRWILQQWGTDVLRKSFHDDIWIASVEHKLLNVKDDIVITDCRFKNELDAIKRVGGVTIRANRGEPPEWHDWAVSYNRGDRANLSWATSKRKLDEFNIHASEYSSVGLDYDYQVDNNGTIDQLHEQINQLLSRQFSK